MTLPSTRKATIVRVGVIVFSACMMGGFVWYSHIKAQPKSGEPEAVAQTTQATILPGSKRSNAAIVPDDIDRLVVNKDGVTIDLNLAEPAAGQSAASPTSEKGMILPSSKLGVFRDAVTIPEQVKASGESRPAPPPVLISGSKSFAGPVLTTQQLGALIVGKEKGEVSPASSGPTASNQASEPPSRVMMGGSKDLPLPPISAEDISKMAGKNGTSVPQSPPTVQIAPSAAAPNQDAPIFTSSKSGPIFKPVPQAPPPPAKAQTQATAPQPSPPAKKAKAKSASQPQTDTPAPVSP